MGHNFESFCKHYQDIENYEKAKADNFKGWCCHHRKGEFTPTEELKALDMYYDRPANELIFVTKAKHNILHFKGKPAWNRDVPMSEEQRNKLCKPKSEEHKKKIGEAMKAENNPNYGKHWYTDGKVNKYCYECPEGFVPGRFLHKRS